MEKKTKYAFAAAVGAVSLLALNAFAHDTGKPHGSEADAGSPAVQSQQARPDNSGNAPAVSGQAKPSENKPAEATPGARDTASERRVTEEREKARREREARREELRKKREEARKAFFEARIAAVKAGLMLTEAQSRLWPPVEQAVREMMELRRNWRDRIRKEGSPDNRFDRIKRRGEMMAARGAAMQKFADAAKPLYESLTDDQKSRVRQLMQGMRRFGQSNRGMGQGGRQWRHHGQRWNRDGGDWGNRSGRGQRHGSGRNFHDREHHAYRGRHWNRDGGDNHTWGRGGMQHGYGMPRGMRDGRWQGGYRNRDGRDAMGSDNRGWAQGGVHRGYGMNRDSRGMRDGHDSGRGYGRWQGRAWNQGDNNDASGAASPRAFGNKDPDDRRGQRYYRTDRRGGNSADRYGSRRWDQSFDDGLSADGPSEDRSGSWVRM